MPQYDGSIRINTEIDAKNVNSQMMRVVNSIRKAEAEVSRLQTRMKELESTNIPTSEYTKLQKELDAAIKKYEELSEQVATFERIGTDKNFTPFRMARDEAQELYMKIEDIRGAMFELEEGGKAFTPGTGTEEYARAAEKVRELTGNIQVSKLRLSELNSKQKPIKEGFEKIKNSAKKAFDATSNGAKKSSVLLSTFSSRLKGIALSLLIFNWISKGFNAMVAGMKKGFESLANYSTDYANSIQSLKNAMSTLGNAFAAAFAPIVQMVIPWLISLINAISTAMTYVAQFIAILGGKSTFTRAKQVQDGYNKSLGGTASAAKKAYGALAKFDDLDVLQKQDDSSGGADAGAAGNLFEEVPVDPKFKNWLDGILEKLKPILDYVEKLKNAFAEGFWDGLGDYEYRFEIIKNGLNQIKKAIQDIWNDPAVRAAADEWAQSVMYMLGSLVGSVASVALTVAAAFVGGLGDYMENNVDRIKGFLVSAFNIGTEINSLLAELFQSIAYIFEAFASESGIRFMSALIGSIADAAMGITELALKLGRDFLQMLVLPITENADGFKTALEGLLDVTSTVLETFKDSIDKTFDKVNEVYDKHFKPLFDSIATGLSELVGKFLDFWNGKAQPVLEEMAEGFQTLWESSVQPVINNIIELFGKMADLFKAVWENVLVPFLGWIIDNVLPLILPVIQTLWNNLLSFVEFVMNAVDSLITVFGGIIDFLTGVFTGDWELAFDGLGEIVEGFKAFNENIWNAIKTVLSTIWGIIKNTATNIFTAIKNFLQTTWTTVKNVASQIWEKVRSIFEEKFNAIRDKVLEIIDKFNEFKENVHDVFNKVRDTINETIGNVIDKISNFIDKIKEAIQAVKDFFASGFEKVTGFFGGGSSGASAASYSAMPMSYSMPEIPALASGSVIRGGNPFLALLGDQPAGQTNIEAPLSTIEQALENVMGRNGYGNERVPVNINIQYDGQTFARLSLDDILSEANRRGYDVSVLGVT